MDVTVGCYQVMIYDEAGKRNVVVSAQEVYDQHASAYERLGVVPRAKMVERFVEHLLTTPIGPTLLADGRSLDTACLYAEWQVVQDAAESPTRTARCMAFTKGLKRCTRKTRSIHGLCGQHDHGDARTMWNTEWTGRVVDG